MVGEFGASSPQGQVYLQRTLGVASHHKLSADNPETTYYFYPCSVKRELGASEKCVDQDQPTQVWIECELRSESLLRCNFYLHRPQGRPELPLSA